MALPNGELYALYVYFKNESKWQGYSRDYMSSKARIAKKRNSIIGLKRFIKFLKKHEFNIKYAIIYDHRPGTAQNGNKIYHWDSQNGVIIDKVAEIIAHGKSL